MRDVASMAMASDAISRYGLVVQPGTGAGLGESWWCVRVLRLTPTNNTHTCVYISPCLACCGTFVSLLVAISYSLHTTQGLEALGFRGSATSRLVHVVLGTWSDQVEFALV